MEDELSDVELLSAAGWDGVPTARILARAATATACVLALDSNGRLGARPYVTIEMLTREDGQEWKSVGDWGPVDGGESGWFEGHAYAVGRAGVGSARVLVRLGDEIFERPVEVDGWWAAIVPAEYPLESFEAVVGP